MQPTMRSVRGFSLIELMVSLTIGSFLILGVSGVMSGYEANKRVTTQLNDIDQAGAFAVYQLDKILRGAGSGFSQGYLQNYGCALNAWQNNTQLLPPATSLPMPFDQLQATIGGTFRLAPVIIVKGASDNGQPASAASDVLITMSGSAGYGEIPTPFIAVPGASSLNVQTTLPFNQDDLVLVTDAAVGGFMHACYIEQVVHGFNPNPPPPSTQVNLGGYYFSSSAANNLTTLTSNGTATSLGNPVVPPVNASASSSSQVEFQAIGVGFNGGTITTSGDSMLASYDLLQTGQVTAAVAGGTQSLVAGQPAVTALVDGVWVLRALYGIDTNNDDIIDFWADPGVSPYTAAELLSGTQAEASVLKTIKAIHIGLIMRTAAAQNTPQGNPVVTPSPLPPLFANLIPAAPTLSYALTLSTTDQTYRYREFEETIPLRNVFLTP